MSSSCAGGAGGKDRLVPAARVAMLAQGVLHVLATDALQLHWLEPTFAIQCTDTKGNVWLPKKLPQGNKKI